MCCMRNYIKNVSYHCKGDYNKMKRMIDKKSFCKNYPCTENYIVRGEKEYPIEFERLDLPPYIIFYRGDIRLLKQASIGIIGSRKPSQYALDVTEKLSRKLAERFVIVSGLAYGIDVCAHKHALDFKTIAVLGCGVDIVYPRIHKDIQNEISKSHLLISEYPPGVGPQKYHFPFRNRLIASLSHDLYVMSGTFKSGTMHTVMEALKLNQNIICLPHPITDSSGSGCNALIADGAMMLTNLNELY